MEADTERCRAASLLFMFFTWMLSALLRAAVDAEMDHEGVLLVLLAARGVETMWREEVRAEECRGGVRLRGGDMVLCDWTDESGGPTDKGRELRGRDWWGAM
jgi:hypothetical protein